jgi:hypothetical protein
MDGMSSELVGLIYHLLPGFLAAWIFYGLTAHPKKDAFERVVQALIFTVIVKAITVGIRKLWWIYYATPATFWTEEKQLVWSLIVATLIGVLFAACANWNVLHRVLGWLKLTKRTSYPSEWYSAFHRVRRYVILHLDGERRLKGWPEEWPDQCDRGHFLILDPKWVDEFGNDIPLVQTERMLVPACEVKFVEMMRYTNEVALNKEEIAKAQEPLLKLHKKGAADGIESTTAAASNAATVPAVAGTAERGVQREPLNGDELAEAK